MRNVDAVVILGGGADGTLAPVLYTKERLAGFLKLRRYFSKPVIVSGRYSAWLKKTPKYTEAEVMKNYLVKHGIPAGDIFLEKNSKDTAGNAYYSKQIIKKHHWKNILIVTTKGHTGRARWIFNKMFGEKYHIRVLGIPTDLRTFGKNPGRKKYENCLLNVYKNGLKSCKNGDDQNIIKTLRRFHPVFSKSKEADKILMGIAKIKQKLLGYTELK